MEVNGEDPFNESLLIDAICALRNDPIQSLIRRKRRKKAPPKVFVKLHPEFIISPPPGFKPMPADDPRTKIPSQITEMFGSGDSEMFRRVMISHCDPNIVHYMQYDGKQNPFGPNTRSISGVGPFIDYCMAVFQSIPDFVATIYEQEFYYNEETNESYACYKCVGFMTKVGVVSRTEPSSSSSSNEGGQRLPDYALKPMQSVKTFQIAKYTYLMNAENKITKYCHLFKQMTHDPDVVSLGLASKLDKKKLKSKFGSSSNKRQKNA